RARGVGRLRDRAAPSRPLRGASSSPRGRLPLLEPRPPHHRARGAPDQAFGWTHRGGRERRRRGQGARVSRWWRLAARNLLRHGRRTLLTGSIVVVGFVAVTMTAGFVSQTFSSLKAATIRGTGGHLRLLDPRAAGKTDDEAAALLPDDWQGLPGLGEKEPRRMEEDT